MTKQNKRQQDERVADVEGNKRRRFLEKPYRVNPTGRPTEYEPEFCGRVVKTGAVGLSLVQIARDLGVIRQTLKNWTEAHPEFLVALIHAREASQAWWDDQGMQGNFAGKEFNDRHWAFQVKNRFPDDYKERVEVTSGLAKLNFGTMTDEQLSRIRGGEHPYSVLAATRAIAAPQDVGEVEVGAPEKAEAASVAPPPQDDDGELGPAPGVGGEPAGPEQG